MCWAAQPPTGTAPHRHRPPPGPPHRLCFASLAVARCPGRSRLVSPALRAPTRGGGCSRRQSSSFEARLRSHLRRKGGRWRCGVFAPLEGEKAISLAWRSQVIGNRKRGAMIGGIAPHRRHLRRARGRLLRRGAEPPLLSPRPSGPHKGGGLKARAAPVLPVLRGGSLRPRTSRMRWAVWDQRNSLRRHPGCHANRDPMPISAKRRARCVEMENPTNMNVDWTPVCMATGVTQ